MGKKVGFPQNFYIEGKDLSGDVGSLDRIACPKTVLEATGINKSAVERLPGLGDGEISFNPFFNKATNQEHAALKGLPTADVVVLYMLGTAAGDKVAGLTAKQINYDWRRPPDGSLMGNVQCLGDGNVLEWGEAVSAGKITHSSAATSASVDNSASSSAGAAGFLQVFSVGSGTPTFIIQDSSDNSSFATLISFATQAQGAERKTVSGTVDRYLRPQTAGTFTDAVFALGLRRGESVDVKAY